MPKNQKDKKNAKPEKKTSIAGNASVNVKQKKPKKVKKVQDPEKKFISKIIFFAVANLLCIIFLFLLLGELPNKAGELKTLINSKAKAEASSKVNLADLEIKSTKDKSDVLAGIFPDENALVGFVKEVEKLEAEGLVKNFSFANTQPVRDRTKTLGIPIVIEMRGSWEQINTGLQRLFEAPYLIRAITITAEPLAEEGVVDFKYGGFLYVDDSFE